MPLHKEFVVFLDEWCYSSELFGDVLTTDACMKDRSFEEKQALGSRQPCGF